MKMLLEFANEGNANTGKQALPIECCCWGLCVGGGAHIADATISEAVLSTCIHIHMQQPAWLGNGRCMGASCRAWLTMW